MDDKFLEDVGVLHHFMRGFMNQCNTVTDRLDINKTQAHVLTVVGRNKKYTMTQISETIGLEKGSFTTVVDSLIRKGYLVRIRNEEDRRKIALELTAVGKDVAKQIEEQTRANAQSLFTGINQEQMEAVKQAVHVLADYARTVGGVERNG